MPLPPEFTREQLVQAADAPDRGGLTIAGRALHKHGSRSGSVFPTPVGNAASLNRVARQIVEQILSDPGTIYTRDQHRYFGEHFDIYAPNGRGLRYRSNGELMGFLEPRR